jgi:hypothetical protein
MKTSSKHILSAVLILALTGAGCSRKHNTKFKNIGSSNAVKSNTPSALADAYADKQGEVAPLISTEVDSAFSYLLLLKSTKTNMPSLVSQTAEIADPILASDKAAVEVVLSYTRHKSDELRSFCTKLLDKYEANKDDTQVLSLDGVRKLIKERSLEGIKLIDSAKELTKKQAAALCKLNIPDFMTTKETEIHLGKQLISVAAKDKFSSLDLGFKVIAQALDVTILDSLKNIDSKSLCAHALQNLDKKIQLNTALLNNILVSFLMQESLQAISVSSNGITEVSYSKINEICLKQ